MPNQPYDEEQQRNRQQPRGPRYQQGNPYRPNGYGQNPYHPGNRQNPTSFGSSLQREFTRNGHFSFPWWAILMGFVMWFPLGFIFLAINQVMRQRPARGPQGGARQGQNQYRQQTAQAQPERKESAAAAPQQSVRTSSEEKSKADILMIVGIILDGESRRPGRRRRAAGQSLDTDRLPGHCLVFGGNLASCCLLLWRSRDFASALGGRSASWMQRRKYCKYRGQCRLHMHVEDIAASLGCSEQDCYQHLENCIEKGVFGAGAYLDMRSRALIVRGNTAGASQQAGTSARAEQRRKPTRMPRVMEESENILRELRRVNDAIPDEEMSDKISRLEAVSSKIFAQIQENPEKLPQMRKFMDYYLPTSLKLLDTYAELDAQGIEGTNIRESKRRIEQSMDTLVVAFENQLDKMFQDDALDVSADIDVMEKMLSADGLTGNSDPFGLSGSNSIQ